MADGLVIQQRHGSTLVLRLNRPEAGNAIDRASAQELLAALQACQDDADLRAVVITGTEIGRAHV